jgi:hypothetical protein
MTGKKVCGLMSPGTTKKCQQQHPLGLSDMRQGSKSTPNSSLLYGGIHGTEGLTKIFKLGKFKLETDTLKCAILCSVPGLTAPYFYFFIADLTTKFQGFLSFF